MAVRSYTLKGQEGKEFFDKLLRDWSKYEKEGLEIIQNFNLGSETLLLGRVNNTSAVFVPYTTIRLCFENSVERANSESILSKMIGVNLSERQDGRR